MKTINVVCNTAVPMKFKGTDRLQQLFTSRSRWIKNDFARSADGYYTNVDHASACKFCLLGGMRRCYPVSSRPRIREKLMAAIRKLHPKKDWQNITAFNDHRRTTFENILRVIKEAGV